MNAIAQAVKHRRERKAGRVGRPPLRTALDEWANAPIEPFKGIEDLLGRPLSDEEKRLWLVAGLMDQKELE